MCYNNSNIKIKGVKIVPKLTTIGNELGSALDDIHKIIRKASTHFLTASKSCLITFSPFGVVISTRIGSLYLERNISNFTSSQDTGEVLIDISLLETAVRKISEINTAAQISLSYTKTPTLTIKQGNDVIRKNCLLVNEDEEKREVIHSEEDLIDVNLTPLLKLIDDDDGIWVHKDHFAVVNPMYMSVYKVPRTLCSGTIQIPKFGLMSGGVQMGATQTKNYPTIVSYNPVSGLFIVSPIFGTENSNAYNQLIDKLVNYQKQTGSFIVLNRKDTIKKLSIVKDTADSKDTTSGIIYLVKNSNGAFFRSAGVSGKSEATLDILDSNNFPLEVFVDSKVLMKALNSFSTKEITIELAEIVKGSDLKPAIYSDTYCHFLANYPRIDRIINN